MLKCERFILNQVALNKLLSVDFVLFHFKLFSSDLEQFQLLTVAVNNKTLFQKEDILILFLIDV